MKKGKSPRIEEIDSDDGYDITNEIKNAFTECIEHHIRLEFRDTLNKMIEAAAKKGTLDYEKIEPRITLTALMCTQIYLDTLVKTVEQDWDIYTPPPITEEDMKEMKVADLRKFIEDAKLKEPETGSGKNGRVLRSDYEDVIRKYREEYDSDKDWFIK